MPSCDGANRTWQPSRDLRTGVGGHVLGCPAATVCAHEDRRTRAPTKTGPIPDRSFETAPRPRGSAPAPAHARRRQPERKVQQVLLLVVWRRERRVVALLQHDVARGARERALAGALELDAVRVRDAHEVLPRPPRCDNGLARLVDERDGDAAQSVSARGECALGARCGARAHQAMSPCAAHDTSQPFGGADSDCNTTPPPRAH